MRPVLKLGSFGIAAALCAALGLLVHVGGNATPALAQVTSCATLSSGETCTFSNSVTVNANNGTNATITINVTTTGVTVTTASASGNSPNPAIAAGTASCTPLSGAGTTTLTLTCPNGLTAGGSISVTFSQALTSITATVTYNANQTAQLQSNSQAITGSCTTATAATTWSCAATTTSTVVSGDTMTAAITITNTDGGTYSITSPALGSMIGTCPLVTSPLPTAIASGTASTLTWQCGAGQSFPAGPVNVAGTVSTAFTAGSTGADTTTTNANCPGGSATSVQPSPCAAYSGSSVQVFTFQNASSTTTPAATSTSTATATGTATSTAAPASTPTPMPACATVTYGAGFNLVGGPTGTLLNGVAQPIYTLQATDTSYVPIITNVLTAPEGFFANFGTATTVSLPCTFSTSPTITLPLPLSHLLMVGNPFDGPATVTASNASTYVLMFNNATNSFGSWVSVGPGQSITLATGQGAFVFSYFGGTLTMTST